MTAPVTVIGVGDDGCLGLPARAMQAIATADVLVGGERLLGFFPEFRGERIRVAGPLAPVLDRVATLADEHRVAVLASGDPLFFGIGGLVVERVGAAHVEVLPHPSSIQWAFARLGLPWHDAAILSAHGRSRRGLAARLRRVAKAAILTDPDSTPARIAAHLLEHGERDLDVCVCEHLGGPGERVRRVSLAEAAALEDVAALNLLVVTRPAGWRPPPVLPYLDEDTLARRVPKRGLVTKREVRALSIAALAPRPGDVIWDVGAGSGSVGIEAALLCPEAAVHAVEVDPECVAMIGENLRALGADNVEVVAGLAPDALPALPDPDAVFVGGSKGALAPIVAHAWARLRAGGRLVVNAITLDNVAEAYTVLRGLGEVPELVVASCARGAPLARYVRYEAQNPVHIFTVRRP